MAENIGHFMRIPSGSKSPEIPQQPSHTSYSVYHNRNDSGYSTPRSIFHRDDVLDSKSITPFESSFEQNKITAKALTIHYKFLKSEIDPKEVEDHLLQYDAIDSEFLDKSNETQNRRRRVDILVKHVFQKAIWFDDHILSQFEQSLRNANQCHVVEKLAEPISVTGHSSCGAVSNGKLKAFTKDMESCIIENVDPILFIDDLVTNGGITFNDHEDIFQLSSRREKISLYMRTVKQACYDDDEDDDDDDKLSKLIQPMIDVYPKLYEEFERKSHRKPPNMPLVKSDSLVEVRCHFKGSKRKRDLRQIERNCVQNFNLNPACHEDLVENIIEDCRCKFEKLTIASVVFHLRTQDHESLDRIFKACEDGKAKQWILSLLDKDDLKRLTEMHGTKMQIEIVVAEKGNISCLQLRQSCLCNLNRNKIHSNFELIQETIDDIDDVLEKFCELRLYGLKMLESFKPFISKKKITCLLHFLLRADTPQIYFCVLQKHIQMSKTSNLQTILQEGPKQMLQIDKDDILHHVDYLMEELDVRAFDIKASLRDELFQPKTRRERVDQFLRYLSEEDDITWFEIQLKESQKYIWDVITSAKQNKNSSERDLLAVHIMNDHIVEEIDPLHLKQRITKTTAQKLRFLEFEHVTSRRERAQCFINRLSIDDMDEILTAMRQCDYERIVEEIKAGSMSERYECPRLSQHRYEGKCVFHYQMEIDFDLTKCGYVYINHGNPKTHTSTKRFEIKEENPHSNFRQKLIQRQKSIESLREYDSGIYSASDDNTTFNGIPEVHEFEDEAKSISKSGFSSLTKGLQTKRLHLPRLPQHRHKMEMDFDLARYAYLKNRSAKTQPSTEIVVFNEEKPRSDFRQTSIKSIGYLQEQESGISSASVEYPSLNEFSDVQDFEDEGINISNSGSSSLIKNKTCSVAQLDMKDNKEKQSRQSLPRIMNAKSSFSGVQKFRKKFLHPSSKLDFSPLLKPEKPKQPLERILVTSIPPRRWSSVNDITNPTSKNMCVLPRPTAKDIKRHNNKQIASIQPRRWSSFNDITNPTSKNQNMIVIPRPPAKERKHHNISYYSDFVLLKSVDKSFSLQNTYDDC